MSRLRSRELNVSLSRPQRAKVRDRPAMLPGPPPITLMPTNRSPPPRRLQSPPHGTMDWFHTEAPDPHQTDTHQEVLGQLCKWPQNRGDRPSLIPALLTPAPSSADSLTRTQGAPWVMRYSLPEGQFGRMVYRDPKDYCHLAQEIVPLESYLQETSTGMCHILPKRMCQHTVFKEELEEAGTQGSLGLFSTSMCQSTW